MLLQMFVDGKLIDTALLSVHKIQDAKEQEYYIQGAVNDLLEKWEDWLKDQNAKPQFFILVSGLR